MRRRLLWLGGALAVVVGVVAGAAFWAGTKDEPPETFASEDAYVYHEPETVKLSKVERAKALSTAANFVTHAVARQKVELAYDLAAPSLKAGITRAQWRTQDIPVVPFPVEEARWKIEYSYTDALGLQVLLFPTAKSKLRPSVFAMELTPTGHGDNRWLVSSWAPVGMTATGGAAPAPVSSGTAGVANLGDVAVAGGEARLGAEWLLAPLALIAIVPLIIAGFYVRGWRRGRRAEAAYASRDRA